MGLIAGMNSAWQAVDDAVYTPWEAASDATAYAKGKADDLESYVKDELPDIIKTETELGLGSLALAIGGALVVGGGTLYLLSEGKAMNALIKTLDPSRALKGLKVGF